MKDKIHYLTYKTLEQDQGRQVLDILRKEMKLTTRKIRAIKKEEKGILLDGLRVTVRQVVKGNQYLQIMLNDRREENHLLPFTMPLDILYEDDDLIFVNKMAGIVSHPSLGHKADSLANGVKAYFLEKDVNDGIHLIGRLDKDTSGILGIAKNGVTKERMVFARQQGRIRKEYLAFVEGQMESEEGCIDYAMEEYRDQQDGNHLKMRKSSVEGQGLEAKTHYKLVKQFDHYALILLYLETGRMHQIRFHMSSVGHPLLGDDIYGHGKSEEMSRTALHAWRVEFPHPYDENGEKKITLTAPLPEDMKRLLSKYVLDFLAGEEYN